MSAFRAERIKSFQRWPSKVNISYKRKIPLLFFSLPVRHSRFRSICTQVLGGCSFPHETPEAKARATTRQGMAHFHDRHPIFKADRAQPSWRQFYFLLSTARGDDFFVALGSPLPPLIYRHFRAYVLINGRKNVFPSIFDQHFVSWTSQKVRYSYGRKNKGSIRIYYQMVHPEYFILFSFNFPGNYVRRRLVGTRFVNELGRLNTLDTRWTTKSTRVRLKSRGHAGPRGKRIINGR